MTRTPFQKALDAAVSAAVAPLRAEIQDLKEQISLFTPAKLTAAINAVLLEQLGAEPPRRAPAPDKGKGSFTCPRQPHKGKCPSAWCRKAADKSAAEA